MRRAVLSWVPVLLVVVWSALHHGPSAPLYFEPLPPSTARPLPMGASVDEVLANFSGPSTQPYGGADFASYLRAGMLLLDEGRFEWAYARLWPPGQALLAAAVVKLTGRDHYPLKMSVTGAVAVSAALLVVLWAARVRLAWLYLCLAWLLVPALRDFVLGIGSAMSEAVSGALFMAALPLWVRGFTARRGRALWGASGAVLGLAALFRPYYEMTAIHMLMGLGGAVWIVLVLRARTWRLPPSTAYTLALAALVTALCAQAVTAPWRLYRVAAFGDAGLSNFDQIATWAWAHDDELPSFHRTGNTACHVEPELCELVRANRAELRPSLVRKLIFMTAISRPGRWLGYKVRGFDWLWFGADWPALRRAPGLLLEGVLLLVLGFGAMGTLAWRWWRRRATPAEIALLVASVGFVLANVGGFALFQFEWRYSLGLRLGALVLPLLAVAARRRPGGEAS